MEPSTLSFRISWWSAMIRNGSSAEMNERRTLSECLLAWSCYEILDFSGGRDSPDKALQVLGFRSRAS